MRASVEAFTHFLFYLKVFFLVTCPLLYVCLFYSYIYTSIHAIYYIYVIICILYIHILQETFCSLWLVSSLFSYLLAIKGICWFDYWKVLGYNWFQAWLDPGAKKIIWMNFGSVSCCISSCIRYFSCHALSLHSGPQKIQAAFFPGWILREKRVIVMWDNFNMITTIETYWLTCLLLSNGM